MTDFNSLFNTPGYEAIRKMQEELKNSDFSSSLREVKKMIDSCKFSTAGITAALREYQDCVAPLTESMKSINNLYAPILEQTKKLEGIYNNSIASVLQGSTTALKMISELNYSAIQSIADSLPKYDLLSKSILQNINFDTVAELYDQGEVTDDDVAEELNEIVSKKEFSISETWNNIKKAKWFLAVRLLLVIIMFVGSPVIDKAKDSALETLGVNEFWENSGIYEWIDSVFNSDEFEVVTEQEAKETVVQDNIGNVSKKKRDELLDKIQELRTYISAAEQDDNTARLLSYLSDLAKDVNGKKYGLVFEEHREEIDEVLDTHTPVLTEDTDLFIDNGGQMNFLIEGDNLASLKMLEKTHKGKIDLIYIDPPYNTNNKDFVYDDTFVDFTDSFRHSKWVSFIYKRLSYARELLTKRGVIFISIDDNEQATLRLICDEILGENNFVSQLVWEKKKKGSFLSNSITNIKEYVLVYAKNISDFTGLVGEITTKVETYPCINAPNKREIRHIPKGIKSNYKDKNFFLPNGSEISDTTMSIVLHSDLVIREGILAEDLDIEGNWRYSQEAMTEYAINGELYLTRDLYLRRIVSDARSKMMKDVLPRVGDNPDLAYNTEIDINNLFESGWGSNEDADEELRLIFGKQHLFDYPKPVRLITKLIAAYRHKDITCVDFFAGSGTLGEATMKLNALDGGNRKYILCTNNQNDIARNITYERIKKVIDRDNYATSLKYYRVDYIPISERMYYEYADELLLHIRELVELENGINFTDNAEIAIVLTDEELAEFIDGITDETVCRKLYMGHDILPDEEQQETLSTHDIEVSIIPDYYYRDLQEG